MDKASTSTPTSLGLIAAIYRISTQNPATIDVTSYSDEQAIAGDDSPRRFRLRNDQKSAFTFPGRFDVTCQTADGKEKWYDLNVEATGAHSFDVTLQDENGKRLRGLAMLDPFDPNVLLISFWQGEIKPYGVVKYTIRNDNSLSAHYISEMSPQVPGRGQAIGDTTDGFPGRYALTYFEENGKTWGPYDWVLSARGDIIDLVWRDRGKVICRGFGFIDPYGPPAIVVNYRAVRED